MSGNRFSSLSRVAESSMAPSPAAASGAAPRPPTSQPRTTTRKRKGHRGGKKKRSRRKSFAILDDDDRDGLEETSGQGLYNIPSSNLSGTSIDSEALLDHRDQKPMRPRRSSTITGPSPFQNPFGTNPIASRLRTARGGGSGDVDDGDSQVIDEDENAPLLGPGGRQVPQATPRSGGISYGARETRRSRPQSQRSASSRSKLGTSQGNNDGYDVNHPPSMPGSPALGPSDHMGLDFGDVMIRDEFSTHRGSPGHSIDVGDDLPDVEGRSRAYPPGLERRGSQKPPEDVCFPGPGLSELGDEDGSVRYQPEHQFRARRHRQRWPNLDVLEEWKHFEKEGRTDERRVKTITEPQLINGRLRPVRKGWYQTDEDAPYRFTYFNEEFQSTIHSQTISELVQPGGGFQELFIPDPRILSDDEYSEDEDEELERISTNQDAAGGFTGDTARLYNRQGTAADSARERLASPQRDPTTESSSRAGSGRATPSGVKSPNNRDQKSSQESGPEKQEKPIRYGDRPVWWLDILSPTEAEMKVIAKAFGIHPLTAEDIMLQEAREKVELFRHYYFVNYRSFDQDNNSENFLEPVNMYVVVFREGVLSFHFSLTPHPANVRRRIRQLRDYLILSSDWISYAIIDDITDVFQPLIQNIEEEVDHIDETILQMHSFADKRLKDEQAGNTKSDDMTTQAESSVDMLRRVGDCRRRVMSLYRLLGNKADVIKGFAKRCNERWEVAPRSEIGLYLGDIQDHIVTMTSNLGHYEKLLARSHGNYLAQINIRMNERQEQTADVLGRLTVLGTIVLPMNIITGLWGMNVWVPGQEYEGDLKWFVCITAGLILFGLACYMLAKRVYKIV